MARSTKNEPVERRDATQAPAERARSSDVAAFLHAARTTPKVGTGRRGRLIFALDATMSRQPTWDLACHLQSEMFAAAAAHSGLDVQLVYFRGRSEARASRWVSNAAALADIMSSVSCRGGLTQIGRVLDHAGQSARKQPVSALVYVGDAMEEDIDLLCHKAGDLALHGVRAFMFLEGSDPAATRTYREIARITRGVCLPFDAGAANELRALLRAVGAYAAGGKAALEAEGSAAARRLLSDLRS